MHNLKQIDDSQRWNQSQSCTFWISQTGVFTHKLLDLQPVFFSPDICLCRLQNGSSMIGPLFFTQCEDQLCQVYEHWEVQHKGYVLTLTSAGEFSFENTFETHSWHAPDMSECEPHALTVIPGGVPWRELRLESQRLSGLLRRCEPKSPSFRHRVSAGDGFIGAQLCYI